MRCHSVLRWPSGPHGQRSRAVRVHSHSEGRTGSASEDVHAGRMLIDDPADGTAPRRARRVRLDAPDRRRDGAARRTGPHAGPPGCRPCQLCSRLIGGTTRAVQRRDRRDENAPTVRKKCSTSSRMLTWPTRSNACEMKKAVLPRHTEPRPVYEDDRTRAGLGELAVPVVGGRVLAERVLDLRTQAVDEKTTRGPGAALRRWAARERRCQRWRRRWRTPRRR